MMIGSSRRYYCREIRWTVTRLETRLYRGECPSLNHACTEPDMDAMFAAIADITRQLRPVSP